MRRPIPPLAQWSLSKMLSRRCETWTCVNSSTRVPISVRFAATATAETEYSIGLIATAALIIWKTLMLVTGSESPIVVVLSGSMEPGTYPERHLS